MAIIDVVKYQNVDGVKFGAYYANNKWSAYVYTKGYTSRSAAFLNAESIDKFIEMMQQAKALIAEKTV